MPNPHEGTLGRSRFDSIVQRDPPVHRVTGMRDASICQGRRDIYTGTRTEARVGFDAPTL